MSKQLMEIIKAQQAIIENISPAVREIFWIARVWNDHNFDEIDMLKKCQKITAQLTGSDKDRGVDLVNEWLEQCGKVQDMIDAIP